MEESSGCKIGMVVSTTVAPTVVEASRALLNDPIVPGISKGGMLADVAGVMGWDGSEEQVDWSIKSEARRVARGTPFSHSGSVKKIEVGEGFGSE